MLLSRSLDESIIFFAVCFSLEAQDKRLYFVAVCFSLEAQDKRLEFVAVCSPLRAVREYPNIQGAIRVN